jgi:hypothetical protein
MNTGFGDTFSFTTYVAVDGEVRVDHTFERNPFPGLLAHRRAGGDRPPTVALPPSGMQARRVGRPIDRLSD